MPELSLFDEEQNQPIAMEVEPFIDHGRLASRETEKQEFSMLLSYWRAYAAAKLGNQDMYRMFIQDISSTLTYVFGVEFFEGSI